MTAAPRPSLRRMWRIWSVYGVSSILSRSLAFLLLPVYTRVLSPEEWGIRAMVALGLDVIALLCAFGLKEAINRFYTAGDGVRRPSPEAASSGIIAHATFIGIGVSVALVFAPWLAGVLLGDRALAPYLRLGLIADVLPPRAGRGARLPPRPWTGGDARRRVPLHAARAHRVERALRRGPALGRRRDLLRGDHRVRGGRHGVDGVDAARGRDRVLAGPRAADGRSSARRCCSSRSRGSS